MAFEIGTVVWIALGLLLLLGVFDLWVGVASDAVNFLNSAVGARAARRGVVLAIASLALVLGCLFADGMMEVARKGIFHPKFFLNESGALDLNLLLTVYVGVMVADVILLDAYNTFGLPTSTTVSIVSGLLGAALAIGVWTLGFSNAFNIINHGQVLEIYTGIGLSVIVAFALGYAVMLVCRLGFSFHPEPVFRKVGWLFTGVASASLFYFIILVGGKHASFMTPERNAWVQQNMPVILGSVFALGALLGHWARRRYAAVQKALILAGTAGLAIAFAGNDLVNFIGPTVAAFQATFQPEAFAQTASAAKKVATPGIVLVLAALVMVVTMWRSRKARTVIDTEVRLGHQGEEKEELFKPTKLSIFIVRTASGLASVVSRVLPSFVRRWVADRLDTRATPPGQRGSFDLLRGTVNLIVAGILISIGTSWKLPLSTTFVTFMVAMGTSLADGAWDGRSAPSRVAGVLTVLGGWAVTAFFAAGGAFCTTSVLYWLGLGPGMAVLAAAFMAITWQLAALHTRRQAGKSSVVDRMDDDDSDAGLTAVDSSPGFGVSATSRTANAM